MRSDSIPQAKSDIWAAIKQRSGISAFSAGSPVVSVGMTRMSKGGEGHFRGRDAYKALILAESADAARIAEDAIGRAECEVVLMTEFAKARVTSEYLQQTRDPLEIGQQIRPRNANWVGTGGIFLKSGHQITNRHVVGMDAPLGKEMRQGDRRYGEVDAMGEIDPSNARFDVAAVLVDDIEARKRWDWGLKENVAGIRSVRADEIGDPTFVTGQTDGTQEGILWATNVDNLPVGYDQFTGWFDNLNVRLDPKGGSFSLPGYSGSSIMMPSDNYCTDLLFAGGPDAQGRDLTFSCDMPGAIRWVGLKPVLT